VLAGHAVRTPGAIAVVEGDRRVPYAELLARVNRIARALLASGVRRGDRVGTLAPPSLLFFETYLATVSIGAIWQGLNPVYQGPEFSYLLGDAAPKLVFMRSPFEGRDYATELSTLGSPVDEFIVSASATIDDAGGFLDRARQCSDEHLAAARATVAPEDTAVIVYTSGTTGRPKGAMLSHRAMVLTALANVGWMGDDLERSICAAPINHVGGLNNVCMNVFTYGGTITFYPKVDLEALYQLGLRERPTMLPSSPTFFLMMLGCEAGQGILRLPRMIVFGGAKTPASVLEQLVPFGMKLASAYGQTETCGIVTRSDYDAGLEVMAETIGKPLTGAEFRVWHSTGRECADGEHGELQMRGPYLMSGYFGRPEATAEAFTDDGYLCTGDIGYRRPDGNLVLVGRAKEMFKSGGYNVYPVEIEQAICEHPDVLNAAVLPVPHPLYQEVGHAFVMVTPERSLDGEQLRAFLHERLANYKVPKSFTFERELPLMPTTKIDKQSLRRRLESMRQEA
jgi:acyl-CoA synthetase (AMP-forming)/AMP-acid ligase II